MESPGTSPYTGTKCRNCLLIFTKQGKGYNRRRLLSMASPRSARLIFPDFSPDEKTFLCTTCAYMIQKAGKRKRGKKRTFRALSPPKGSPSSPEPKRQETTLSPGPSTPTSPSCKNTSPPHSSKEDEEEKIPKKDAQTEASPEPEKLKDLPWTPFGAGPRAQAFSYLRHSQYLSLFRILLKVEAAKKAFFQCVSEVLKNERAALVKDTEGPFRKQPDPKVLSEFSWAGCLEWGEGKGPLTLNCLRSMFPPAKRVAGQHTITEDSKRRPMTETEAQVVLDKRRGMVLSTILFTANLRKLNFVQSCLGVECWRQGNSLKMFNTLNSLGVCQSHASAVRHLDRMRGQHDHLVKEWKASLEEQKKGKGKAKRKLTFGERDKMPKVSSPSYSLTWDNVQLTSHVKHQSKEHSNKFLLWAFTFAHKNKVNFGHLVGEGQKAVDVPLQRILPTPEDYDSLRERMTVIVKRILVDNISALANLKKAVVRHIPHMYTDEMVEKSSVVSLGVVSSNPSTTEGVLEIMDTLHKSVPVVGGKPYPILCCGDGLSVERMVQCHDARLNGSSPAARLEGLVEAPQEFHKEMILLQDTMDHLFKQESISSRGTLTHLKGFFKHKNLKKEVKANVQHVWDFIQFVTSGYVTLCATTMCDMTNVDQTPVSYPDNAEDQQVWLESLAQQVVDLVWMAPDQDEIKRVAMTKRVEGAEAEEVYPFCSCGEDKEEQMVKCCSDNCISSWFHLSCANLEAAPEDDWYCSPDCEYSRSYMYCFCRKKRDAYMSQCHLKEMCKRHEWYHKECLTPKARLESKAEIWYCSEECLFGAKDEDKVQNYSKAVMWEGLVHLARKDAVKEGDGFAMAQFWKMDLLQFWKRRHKKYFVIAHQMLTGIEGHLPERLQQDMLWNRVANLQGKPGGNVGLDLVNEFLNNEFKDMLKRSRGNYTDEQVARCAELSGSFGKEVDRLFSEAGLGSHCSPDHRSSHYKKYRKDVATFVEEFQRDGLFAYLPGRYHKGFKNFKYSRQLRDPKKMAHQMMRLAEDMDDRLELRDKEE